MFRSHFSKIPLAACALFVSSGVMHAAAAITASPTAIVLACDTLLGSAAPTTVTISQTGGSGALTVTPTSSSVGPVILPGAASVANGSSTPFLFSAAAGCKGLTSTTTATLTFAAPGVTSVTVAVTFTVTSAATALNVSPSPVVITCTKSGSSYTPGPSVTVNVTSAANGGTPFTVDNTTNALPSWLSLTPLLGGTASATPVALTAVAATGCGSLPVGNTTFSVHLLNAPAPDKVFPVTIQVGAAAGLTPSPTTISLSYTKGSGTYTPASTSLTASSATFYSVDTTTLPVWLNTTTLSGTTPSSLSFTPTAGAETLALGTYSANVRLKVSGSLDTVIPVKLQVVNAASTLSVAEGTTRVINWTLGTTIPSLLITPISSDAPISYSVAATCPGSGACLNAQLNLTKGLAYSFGSPISVTFPQSVFGAAVPGTDIGGIVTITPASGSAVVVTVTVHVRAPSASISAITPSALPTATSGSFTVALTGFGFVVSSDPTLATKVGVVSSGGLIVPDSNITATIVNLTNIVLTIAVPTSADPYLPFGTGGTVNIGVCNPQGTSCSTPTGTFSFTIGVNPIIRAVASSSSFNQATPPALTPVAPYDLLSVFGSNFCVSSGTGCTGGNAILYGVTDPVTLKYASALTPDAAGSANLRNVTATFQQHSSPFTAIATAPILFASNNQINLIVPDAVKNYVGKTVDLVISFGYGTGATMLKSAPYSLTVATTNPGVFTVGGDGQGSAAALLSPSNTLVSSSNPAGAGPVPATDSDIVQFYMTGLGVPDSVDATPYWSSLNCMAPASYFAAVNSNTGASPALTSNDGLVVQSIYFPASTLAPCITPSSAVLPSVTVGGISATVTYAGWVADAVAGLYQVNVRMPAQNAAYVDASGATVPATTAAMTLPVVFTTGSVSSQTSGVTINAVRRLAVALSGAASGGTYTMAHGGTLPTAGAAFTATATGSAAGSPAYSYTATGLPTGLSLNPSTGVLSGTSTDAAGTFTVVITATDANSWTGKFTLVITLT